MASRFIGSVYPQNFSLTYTMMEYIRRHFSPPVHSKMIQTCKYFFIKNPAIVVKKITFNTNETILSNGNDMVNVDLTKKLFVKIYCFSECSFATNSSWTVFISEGRFRGAGKFFSYSKMEKIAKKKIISHLIVNQYNLTNTEGNPLQIEEIVGLFSGVRYFYL